MHACSIKLVVRLANSSSPAWCRTKWALSTRTGRAMSTNRAMPDRNWIDDLVGQVQISLFVANLTFIYCLAIIWFYFVHIFRAMSIQIRTLSWWMNEKTLLTRGSDKYVETFDSHYFESTTYYYILSITVTEMKIKIKFYFPPFSWVLERIHVCNHYLLSYGRFVKSKTSIESR